MYILIKISYMNEQGAVLREYYRFFHDTNKNENKNKTKP